MNFKVGDRVRRVAEPHGIYRASDTTLPMGATGTVTGVDDGHVFVAPDEAVASGERATWGCQRHTLAPLTPPASDAWADEKVRELVKPKPMDLEREPSKVTA